MASALRLGTSALRASVSRPALNARTAAFNGLRCYSSSKTQVWKLLRHYPSNRQLTTLVTDLEGTIRRAIAREN